MNQLCCHIDSTIPGEGPTALVDTPSIDEDFLSLLLQVGKRDYFDSVLARSRETSDPYSVHLRGRFANLDGYHDRYSDSDVFSL